MNEMYGLSLDNIKKTIEWLDGRIYRLQSIRNIMYTNYCEMIDKGDLDEY